jgi:arylsulfatase A-like enzyme
MSRPNVVLIVLDTARADDAVYRSDDGPTMPTLEALANDGTRFTDATANAPWTMPSHGTLFTGEPPTVHGAHAAHKAFQYEPTLAGRLREAGYLTVGVSNNTWISGEFGFDRGFDAYLNSWQLYQDAVDFAGVARNRTGLLDQLRGAASEFRGNPIKNLLNLLYGKFFRKREDKGARRTNKLIQNRLDDWAAAEEPLFMFVNFLEPHLEYRPPREFATAWLPEDIPYDEAMAVNQDAWACITGEVDMSDRDFRALRGLYRAQLAYVDERLDDLLAAFADAGLREDTVFIVTGDHGEHIGERGFMDHQYSLSEALLSVPLVVTGPGFRNGGEVETPVQLADVPATILDIAGVDSPLDTLLAPKSLTDTESIPTDRPLFAEYLAPQPPLSSLRDRYECRRDLSEFDRRLRSVRRGDAKYVRGSDGSEETSAIGTDSSGATPDDATAHTEDLRHTLDAWAEALPAVTEDGSVGMNDATRERLEDLGYIQ